MASTMSAEEMRALEEKLAATQELVKNNPKEALRKLYDAGIITKRGKLTARYRIKETDNK